MRTTVAFLSLALVVTACSPSEPAVEPTTTESQPISTGAPTTTTQAAEASAAPSTTTTTAAPAVTFAGTTPVTAFVAGSLWNLSTTPAQEVVALPGNRSPAGEPVWTPFGIVLSVDTETDSALWLVDPDSGEATQLTDSAGSFAVAADRETIAWAEHIGAIGAPGSQTKLTESALPELTERAFVTVDGFARVAGYARDIVLLETGDGAGAVVKAWVPADGTIKDATDYVWVLGASRTEPNAVLVTSAIEPKWVVVLSDGSVLPEAIDTLDPPWNFEETGTVAFSPDGATMVLGGTTDDPGDGLVTFRTVSDRAVTVQIVIDDLSGAFFAASQLLWLTNDDVLLLAESWDERSESQPHAGRRFIYECSMSAASCEQAAEIVYEPQAFNEIALVVGAPPAQTVVDPIEGWLRIDFDPALTGDATPVAALGDQGIVAIAGCHRSGPSDWFPMWVSEDGAVWERASGPTATCLGGLVATEFGWVTWAGSDVFVSTDGRTWERLDGPWADEPGWTQFVATNFTITTVVRSRAAENETTTASLWTTTDGVTWEAHPESAAVFDSSDVTKVISGGPGLVAVGASPGGEFVPTAAVWTSADGASWTLVSPHGEGYAEATIFDVKIAGPGYVAVGTDWKGAAFWSSDDGTTWTRGSNTSEPVPEFGHLVAQDITLIDGTVYASGFIWEADAASALPRLWMSPDGKTWEPADYAAYAGRLTFGVSGFEVAGGFDRGISFWPPPHNDLDPAVAFFITE